MIDTIVKTSHTAGLDASYLYYPLYHIFNAIGVEITDMSIKTTLFVLMGLAWQVGILFAFLLFKKLSTSVRFALIACLIFAASSQIIFYASYPIARSLAFVFMMCWLYLILSRADKDTRYLFLSLIVMSALIMTHHLNVLFIIPILILFYLCQLVFIGKTEPNRLINPLFIFLFSISCISYLIWVSSTLSESMFPAIFRELTQMNFYLQSNPSAGYGFSVILGVIYFSFALFLSLLGMRIVFEHLKSTGKILIAGVFALAGFIMLILYIPGPVDLLQLANIIMTSRAQLMVTPFIAFLMAYGISQVIQMKEISRPSFTTKFASYILPAILVITATFFAAIATGNAQDNDDFPNTSIFDTPYFTNSELASFSFLNAETDGLSPLFADYQTVRNEYSLNNITMKEVIRSGDISYIRNGYLILRIGELNRKGALSFYLTGAARSAYRYSIDPLDSKSDIQANLEIQNKIYDDVYVQIFTIHEIIK